MRGRFALPTLGRWALLCAVTAALVSLAYLFHVPAPALLGGLVAAVVVGAFGGAPGSPYKMIRHAAQALLGISLGLAVRPEAVATIAQAWVPILVTSLVTAVLSIGTGLLLGWWGRVGGITGVLGMAAGGASGIAAVAKDLGADEPTVILAQYTRVIVVALMTPFIVVTWLADGPAQVPTAAEIPEGSFPLPVQGLLVVVLMLLGVVVGRVTSVPAGALLVPMVLSSLLGISGTLSPAAVPDPVLVVVYVVIGWGAGLGFDIREARRLLRPWYVSLVMTAILMVGCGLAGVWMAMSSPASMLDGYLATTPGGLFVVGTLAVEYDADVALVTTAQLLRILLIVAISPNVAAWLKRRGPGSAPVGPSHGH